MMKGLRSKYVHKNPRCVGERGDEESHRGLAFLINLAGVRPRQKTGSRAKGHRYAQR
jgi:hypothetical protein